jgi:hypothetical protein
MVLSVNLRSVISAAAGLFGHRATMFAILFWQYQLIACVETSIPAFLLSICLDEVLS